MEMAITQSGKFKIMKISGKIDWENARLLDKEIQSIVDEGFLHVVFNLDEVKFICSGGIGALVYNLNKVRKIGGGMYIISSNEYVKYLFDTLKFSFVFDGFIFDSFDAFREQVMEKVA
jgi:anti-anti-sigma factor